MGFDLDIVRLSATEMCRRVRDREWSPVEVMEAHLAQVERHNGVLNAVCTLSERALDEAQDLERRLQKGGDPGLLCGLPVGIKDVTPTAGLRTTYGSPLYANHVPEEDALVVQRLKAAGAIVIGKTNTPEFAAGGNTFNAVFGATRNPWNPALSAGGSTGGGAAGLAAGMFALADGTDLGGSLRIPASFCGVVGLRPSPGLVPTVPSQYLWDTLEVSGPMARTAEDVALMLQAIAGSSDCAPLYQPMDGRDFPAAVRRGMPSGTRLAYCPDVAGIGVDEDIARVCREAVEVLSREGAIVEEVPLDLSFARPAFLALRGLWMMVQQYTRLEHLDAFGTNVANNLRAGMAVTTEQLAAAEHARKRLWVLFRDVFSTFDAVLTPCMAVPPFPVEQNYPETVAGQVMETYVDWIAPTFVLNMAARPVASVPCGLDASGLPVGLQILGRHRGEEEVLALAAVVGASHRGCDMLRS